MNRWFIRVRSVWLYLRILGFKRIYKRNLLLNCFTMIFRIHILFRKNNKLIYLMTSFEINYY